MRYRMGKAIAEMTDSPAKRGAASLLVAAGAAALEVIAHTAAMRTGLSETVHTAIDAFIIGIAVGLMAWLVFSATHARRRRVLEHIRAVAELNHHVRNALEVIVYSNYVEQSRNTEAVLQSVQRIDNALRELFPAIGERVEDRHRTGMTESRRGAYLLRRRQSD